MYLRESQISHTMFYVHDTMLFTCRRFSVPRMWCTRSTMCPVTSVGRFWAHVQASEDARSGWPGCLALARPPSPLPWKVSFWPYHTIFNKVMLLWSVHLTSDCMPSRMSQMLEKTKPDSVSGFSHYGESLLHQSRIKTIRLAHGGRVGGMAAGRAGLQLGGRRAYPKWRQTQ